MSWTAHQTDEQLREYNSDQFTLQKQATELASLINQAQHVVVFTGAGISTSSGIPDFRGPQGVWTLEAKGQTRDSEDAVEIEQAMPTAAHMALVTLEKQGKLQFLISQNCDGLHRRSGFPVDKLAELHGNFNVEVCRLCKIEYLRDFDCEAEDQDGVPEHQTERKCVCGAYLYDTIVNFGEDLPKKALDRAYEHSKKADLFIVLGSSLTVTPASDMPKRAKKNAAKLVVCNLQKTSMDKKCDLKIFGRTDELMALTLKALNLEPETWILQRLVKIAWSTTNVITVQAIERNGAAASILRQVKLQVNNSIKYRIRTREPFKFVQKRGANNENASKTTSFDITLSFMAHYGEPKLTIRNVELRRNEAKTFDLRFDPIKKFWETPVQRFMQ